MLASVLALCTAAGMFGHTALEDVTAWISAAPQQGLAAAGCRRDELGPASRRAGRRGAHLR